MAENQLASPTSRGSESPRGRQWEKTLRGDQRSDKPSFDTSPPGRHRHLPHSPSSRSSSPRHTALSKYRHHDTSPATTPTTSPTKPPPHSSRSSTRWQWEEQVAARVDAEAARAKAEAARAEAEAACAAATAALQPALEELADQMEHTATERARYETERASLSLELSSSREEVEDLKAQLSFLGEAYSAWGLHLIPPTTPITRPLSNKFKFYLTRCCLRRPHLAIPPPHPPCLSPLSIAKRRAHPQLRPPLPPPRGASPRQRDSSEGVVEAHGSGSARPCHAPSGSPLVER